MRGFSSGSWSRSWSWVARGALLCALVTGLAACGQGDGDGVADAGDRPGESYGNAVTGGICPGHATVKGLDVSEFQGRVNWTSVKDSGKQFAIARIGDGGYVDPTFKTNWSRMKSAGLIRGAYQFFRPNESAAAQASIVVHQVGHLGDGDLPVMLDLEVTGGQSPATIVAKVHTWINAVAAGTGKKPYIYTGAYFWDSYVHSSAFSSRPLNVAWYGTDCPGVPNAWSHWTFHQYTSSGSVPGISGHVDLDLYDGSLASLRAFAGQSIDGPGAVAPAADGLLHVFWKGADDSLEQRHQLSPGGGWSVWSNQGGDLASQPVVVANADGRLEAFVRFSNGTVHHRWQLASGGWHDWQSLGRPVAGLAIGRLAAARNADGRIEVFVRTPDGTMHHIRQVAAGQSNAWGSWGMLAGHLAGSPSVAMDAGGRLHVFARGNNGTVWQDRQTVPGGSWSGWMSLGGSAASDIAATNDADGTLEIFVRGNDGALHHDRQKRTGGWHGWATLHGSITVLPTVIRDNGGRLHVFARGANGTLRHIRQTVAGGSWSGWSDFGGNLSSSPVAGRTADHRLIVFARGADGHLVRKSQLAPGGGWAAWATMGTMEF